MDENKALTGSMPKGFNYGGAYQQSFGLWENNTVYSSPMQDIDLRPQMKSIVDDGVRRVMQKALSTTAGGAGTAGYALIPIYVDPRIVDRSRKYTPLVELISRVTNMGMTADYNVVTAKGGAVTAGEDAALNESNDTYDRASQSIKFIYAVGRVTGPTQAAMPSYVMEGFTPTGAGLSANPFTPEGAPNAKQLEVLMKSRSIKEKEEDLILNGNAGTNATEFNGIIQQQSTTNQLNLGGTDIEWDDVETAVQYAFDDGGRPRIAVASSPVVVKLRKIMLDQFRFGPEQLAANNLPFGIPSAITLYTMIGPITLIPSMYLTSTAGSRQLWFLDTDFIEMRVLQDMTYEDLAKTNDSQKFMLKIYECLIVRAPQFNSYVDNIL